MLACGIKIGKKMDVFVAKLKLMTIPNSNYLGFIIVVAYIIEALPNNLFFDNHGVK
jgi:hypothetical protein